MSFPRADDFTPLLEYDYTLPGSNDFIFNNHSDHFPPVTEDILSEKLPSPDDFDNISPFSSSTRKYFFSTKYEKFHVTPHHRAGYNKIYNFRRSKSFFFEIVDQISDTNQFDLKIHTNDYHMSTIPIRHISTSRLPNFKFQISKQLTHFFSTQRVIPRRLQSKFFVLIRKKLLERINFIRSRAQNDNTSNHMTKTFFNFSYKKYRYYFGIYIPCNHANTKGPFITQTHPCTTPVPFTMSKHRRACIMHHKKLALYCSPNDNISFKDCSYNNYKDLHAGHIYDRWISKRITNFHSQRLGISFNTKYHAYGINNVVRKGSSPIYGKIYYNFQYRNSASSKTEKRQQKRFESQKKRVFNSSNLTQNATREDKFLAARRKNFLFHPEQHICKKLNHLSYKKKFTIPLQSYYSFPLPFPGQDFSIVPDAIVMEQEIPSSSISTTTLEVLNNVPSHFIPIIPDYPIYAGGYLNQPTKSKIKKKNLQPLMVGCDDWLAFMQEYYDAHESKRLYLEELNRLKIKWNTNEDRAEYREDTFNYIMEINNTHHARELKKIEIFDKASRHPKNPGKHQHTYQSSVIQKDQEILEELNDSFSSWDLALTVHHSKYRSEDLISDTIMEDNPLKRRADINGNLDSHYGVHLNKRVCILSHSLTR
ncbi:hypothetical protein RhiirA4_463975 [Rhizophagus irregularis]|uniref:DUF8211 domain-containing protein n=1 Tax=Rhizophagus irregularis TaxID=588596 RepID=A0A2I1GP13_9GLOM|nr:hypothetical protein RhiirA4_463975 [Rhizophagus irregularis]